MVAASIFLSGARFISEISSASRSLGYRGERTIISAIKMHFGTCKKWSVSDVCLINDKIKDAKRKFLVLYLQLLQIFTRVPDYNVRLALDLQIIVIIIIIIIRLLN